MGGYVLGDGSGDRDTQGTMGSDGGLRPQSLSLSMAAPHRAGRGPRHALQTLSPGRPAGGGGGGRLEAEASGGRTEEGLRAQEPGGLLKQ